MYNTFKISPEQKEKIEAWKKEQDRIYVLKQKEQYEKNPYASLLPMLTDNFKHPYYGTIGGSLTYSFTPNSIGVSLDVKHGGTGAEIDVTEYDLW